MTKAARDRDRALANGVEPEGELEDDAAMDDGTTGEEAYGSKTIVIHPGSQNLRIGLATDALPKTVPMCIARRATENESETDEPRPKRVKLEDGTVGEPETWFGEDVRLLL